MTDTVVEVSTKENTRFRPEGINTVQMLKHCSSQFGLGPDDTMNVAERLYLGGFITYPRTESTMYSQNFNFQQVLQSF